MRDIAIAGGPTVMIRDRAMRVLHPAGMWLLAAAIYVLINVVLAPGGLYPVDQDDYHVLGAGYDRLRLLVERPVSANLAYAMGGLGAGFAFAVLNALTVLVAVGALALLSRLLGVQLRWYAVVLFAVIAFNDVSAYEHGKYLGLITNLTSHGFGIGALLLMSGYRLRGLPEPDQPT